MKREELERVASKTHCRKFGWEDAGNASHRTVLAVVMLAFNDSQSTILCEPGLARKTTRPPDVVLVDPEVGVHVIEVKGISFDQIEAIEPGGHFRIRYSVGAPAKNPIIQVRNSMFDIKDATQRAYGGELVLPFKYWVAMPLISRVDWKRHWGEDGFCPPELLFKDDLVPANIANRFGVRSSGTNASQPVQIWPVDQFTAVWSAFGDSSVLYQEPEGRGHRKPAVGTLGEQFDEAAEAYKTLSDDQQRLSSQNWEEGPRLVRGVAGSGKTIVLANNLARRLQRTLGQSENLYEPPGNNARFLAVCFNRTLVPFLQKKIGIAFQQRTGQPIPESTVDVISYNRLMWALAQKGLWRYQKLEDGEDGARAAQYLQDLAHTKANMPDLAKAASYDAIYVDEGQDFAEEDFRLLKELCRTPGGKEPNLYVFYDDAQNLFALGRPNWQSLGLNVRGGRSNVMTECFRTTRPIVESTFNVLYGSCAGPKAEVPTKDFGDLAGLEQKQLIHADKGYWRVRFTKRDGRKPSLSIARGIKHENELIISRLQWLIGEQQVRPEDIQVLSLSRNRVFELANAIENAKIAGLSGVHVTLNEKDLLLNQKGRVSVSTVASAKGYDAYVVLLASVNEFATDVIGRASFYVGCTRAIEYLEVLGYENSGLVPEIELALARL